LPMEWVEKGILSMKGLFGRLGRKKGPAARTRPPEEDQLQRQVSALFTLLGSLYGPDRLVLKASKLGALNLIRSSSLGERVLALQRLVFEDPNIEVVPSKQEIPSLLNEVEEEIADLLARKTVEDKLERKINEKMQERHEEYIQEIKLQVLKEDSPDNAQTLRKYAELEKLEQRQLSRPASELLRPDRLEDVVGQERAIKALLTKLASPYPQHVILYGPPGVGKTTVARLALQYARELPHTPFAKDAPFVEVDGATLRWDPREVSNPLLGSVHDPIYQGARREMADGGIPEPKLGLVTEAHGGVLFIDEIGELDLLLQNKLLKVLEDKRVSFESAYYDPDDPQVPKYIKVLFDKGAPADFILIGATTCQPEEINPALRSRCAEIFFDPLTPKDIERIVCEAAERLGVELEDGVAELIAQYTVEGRKATGLLADAYGLALFNSEGSTPMIGLEEIGEVISSSRLSPYVRVKGSDEPEVGKVFGLAVSGFLGMVLEIEAVAFPARGEGKGSIRFNETAGSMTKDSVFNAASMVRALTGRDLADYDMHVNVIGGAHIDGPSAGAAVVAAIISAVQGIPVRQDAAVTGEISIRGKMKGVGGIQEKIYGARQAGLKKVIIPAENAADVPPGLRGIEVVAAARVEEMLDQLLVGPLGSKQTRQKPLVPSRRAING
jgi:ATP-dependent Lon protease